MLESLLRFNVLKRFQNWKILEVGEQVFVFPELEETGNPLAL
jgi:hypothetical protein